MPLKWIADTDHYREIIPDAYSYSYRSIMGNGTVTLLETFEEKEKGLQRIMEHMAPGAKIEFRPEMLTRTAVWQINVYEFTGKERKAK